MAGISKKYKGYDIVSVADPRSRHDIGYLVPMLPRGTFLTMDEAKAAVDARLDQVVNDLRKLAKANQSKKTA